VERANQEDLGHLIRNFRITRAHNSWSYDQLPMVQRIMNTVEKTTTGDNNSSRILTAQAVCNSSARFALSNTMDTWIQKQHVLIKAAQENQRNSDFHLLVEYDQRITEYPVH